MLHTFELEIIRWIQQIRTPSLDAFFRFLDFFDKPEFFCILIPAIWLIKGQRTGSKLFYILLCSGFTNHVLKTLLASPRPFHLDPLVGLLPKTGYGLPSGAAQTVMLLSALALSTGKNFYKWAVVLPYILFVSFARIYLGIHFPSDILAGWSVGLVLWACYRHLFPFLEKIASKLSPLFQCFLCQIPLILLLTFVPTFGAAYACTSASGVGIGILLNHKLRWSLPSTSHTKEKALRALIGIGGTFLCYLLVSISPIMAFFCTGLWVSTGSLWICKKIQTFQEA
jgi:membrane-associated phospholipid phosphatase